MTITPIRDMNEYKRVKEALRARFEAERTGDQDLFREHSKIFQPLINTQQQTEKAIKDEQDALSNALSPLTRELKRRNDQIDLLAEQPYFQHELPAITTPGSDTSTIASPGFLNVDLDAGLNITDKENLEAMELDLPSTVFKNKSIETALEKIKTENRSIGQKLGTGRVGQKVELREKQVYLSQKQTLVTYKQIIEGLEGARQFVSTPKKSGEGLRKAQEGIDVIYYSNVEDLCKELYKQCATKQAGNNGVNNRINSILDELLRIGKIDKDEYNKLYKNIFNIS